MANKTHKSRLNPLPFTETNDFRDFNNDDNDRKI